MASMPSLADLVAVSGKSAPAFFTADSRPGDSITGNVLDVSIRQALDPQTRRPRVWENGDPVLQAVITLSTDLRAEDDANDNGERSIFIKWWGTQRQAFLDALKAAGQGDLSLGQEFTATFVRTEKATSKAMSDTKVYEYRVG